MRKLILFLAIIVPSMLHAQTSKNGRIQEGLAATRPIACSPGDVWTDTDDALSFQCFPANSWNTFAGSNILPNNNNFTGNNKFTKPLVIGPFTVATLPAPGATALNAIATVTDGTSGADCVTGGSTFQALCINTGAAWLSLGGGSGGTPCTTTALSIQFNNSGAFGCEPDLTFTAPHTLTMGASGILTLTAGAVVNGITAAMIPTLNQSTSGNAATASAFDHTPTNCGAGVSSTGVNSVGNAVGCFTPGGLSNPMLNVGDMIKGGSAGAATNLPGPTTPNGVAQTLIDVPSGGAATPEVWSLAGVPVDATNPATLLVTDRANYLNWTAGTTLALPAVAGSFAFNFPFAIQNTSTTLTITPNAGASDLIDGAASGTLIPNFAAFIYQDGTTAPGHWFSVKFPTFASLGSTCASAVTWSITTGFGCNVGIGSGTVTHTANGGVAPLGQPIIGNATVDTYSSPAYLDCAGFAGADDSLKLQACLVALNTLNSKAGIADGRGLTGCAWSVNPYLAASMPASGKLLLGGGCNTITTNVPFVDHSDWSVEGVSVRGVDTQVGTTIKAGGSFQATYSTGTITVGTPGAAEVITGSGTTWTAAMVGCAFYGANGGANSTFGIITVVGGATSITLGWGQNIGTGAAGGSAYSIACPIHAHGSGGASASGAQFGMSATNINFDCNAVAGCIGDLNWFGQQGTYDKNVGIHNSINIGLDLENQNQQSGPWDNVTVSMGVGCASSAIPIVVRGNETFRGITNSSTGKGACATTLAVGIAVNNNGTDIINPDLASSTIGVLLGGNVACPIACVNLATVVSNSLVQNAFAESTVTTAVEISNALSTGQGNIIMNVTNAGTNALIDQPNSCTITDTRLALYVTAVTGTKVRSTATLCPDTWDAKVEDFSASTWKIPTAAGFTPSATSMFGYNSTNGAQMAWVNSATAFEGSFAAAPSGGQFVKTTGVIGQLVEDVSLSLPGNIHSTGNTAAITTATLCAASAGACNQVGQYHIHWDFIETGTACATPATGGVTFLLTWTDTNATTHSAVSLGMDDASAINAVSQTFHFQTSLAAAWGSGDFNVSTNGSVIQFATGYTACGVGTGQYQLDIGVTRIQ